MKNEESKEVYVVYGRGMTNEGIFDYDGNYFMESPLLEVFDNFESAYKCFRKSIRDSYNDESELYEEYPKNMSDEELFADYNVSEDDEDETDEYEEDSVCWYYSELSFGNNEGKKNIHYSWQVFTKHSSDLVDTTIRPGIYLKNIELQK